MLELLLVEESDLVLLNKAQLAILDKIDYYKSWLARRIYLDKLSSKAKVLPKGFIRLDYEIQP